MTDAKLDQAGLAAMIVCAYVSKNSVRVSDLSGLIEGVHASLGSLRTGTPSVAIAKQVAKSPAVPIKKSITPDFIICLEDGQKFKSLRRHLSSAYNMTADEYREKWGLPADYPMVAASYAAERSALAKESGLGQRLGTAGSRARRKA